MITHNARPEYWVTFTSQFDGYVYNEGFETLKEAVGFKNYVDPTATVRSREEIKNDYKKMQTKVVWPWDDEYEQIFMA